MSIVYSVLQGMVAGGAAVYLQNRLQQETVEKDAGCWTTVALQANHLLLLTAETLRFGGCQLGAFKYFVQTVYVLTPVSLLAPLLGNRVTELSSERGELLNRVYRIGVGALSLVSWAFGDPVFAASSLSMLAIDLAASGTVHRAFVHVSKIYALSALIGYGTQAFFSKSVMAIAASVSTALISIKLCIWEPIRFFSELCEGDFSEGSSSRHRGYAQHRYSYYPSHYDHVSDHSFPSHSFGGENVFCRASVWD